MKKVICILAAAVLSVGTFCGCGRSAESDRISIVTTSFPPYDFTRAVAGDSADVTMLLDAGAEAHSYEPSPMDIAAIQNCDVFVYIGGEGEVWVDNILDSIDTDDMEIIRLFDYVEPLEEEEVEGASPNGHEHHHHEDGDEHEHEVEHDDGDNAEYDEHIWTSPKNARLCVEGIEHDLSAVYPEFSDAYSANAAAYDDELAELDAGFTAMTEAASRDLIIIADRFPFRYLTHDYDLEYYAAFSGCSSESEPSVYTMAFLMNEINEHDVNVIFYLDMSQVKLAKKLRDATGVSILPLYQCHNVTKDDFDNGVTYAELMRRNLENLAEELCSDEREN